MIRDRLHRVRSGVSSAVTSPDVSISEIVGGGWGLVDILGPHVLFLTVYLVTQDTLSAILIALGLAYALVLGRMVRRQAVGKAVGGAALVALSGVLVATTGHDANFYLLQVLRSLALAALLLASMVVRRPLVGVILGPLLGGTAWRRNPTLIRAYWQCTAIWASLVVLRSVLKVPLYLSDDLVGLGIVHLVTGIPLFAVMVVWQLRILRRAYTASPATVSAASLDCGHISENTPRGVQAGRWRPAA